MKLKEIAENHGLTPEGVDYALTQYQIVMYEITNGMLSKLSYDAKDIIRTAQERWCDTCDLKEQEPQETRLVRHYSRPGVYADLWLHCEKCGGRSDNNYKPKYCPECGRKVKWDD